METLTKKQASDLAKDFFKRHPEKNSFLVCSDGTVFYGHAKDHANRYCQSKGLPEAASFERRAIDDKDVVEPEKGAEGEAGKDANSGKSGAPENKDKGAEGEGGEVAGGKDADSGKSGAPENKDKGAEGKKASKIPKEVKPTQAKTTTKKNTK